MTNYKQIILQTISKAIGDTELRLKMMEIINPHIFEYGKYDDAINELIEKREIQYLYYTFPSNGTKIIYFPKETIFNFNQR